MTDKKSFITLSPAEALPGKSIELGLFHCSAHSAEQMIRPKELAGDDIVKLKGKSGLVTSGSLWSYIVDKGDKAKQNLTFHLT